MNYLVLEPPAVTLTINSYSGAVQRDYSTVKSILAATPRGNPRFTAISEDVSPGGRTYYQYLDGVLPFILQYRVFDADNDWQRGLVWVARALRLESGWNPLEWGDAG